MKQITKKEAVDMLVNSDMETILSDDRIGKQMLRSILESGSPEYDMLEPEELEEELLNKFEEKYKVI